MELVPNYTFESLCVDGIWVSDLSISVFVSGLVLDRFWNIISGKYYMGPFGTTRDPNGKFIGDLFGVFVW